MCIFARKDLNVNEVDISPNCIEKDLEICPVELETETSKLIILTYTESLQEILIGLLKI
jgi:hypothetical protein